MRKSRIIVTLVLMVIVLSSAYGLFRYRQTHSVAYQLDRPANGTNEEKSNAMYFLGRRNVKEAIPLLIKNVDSDAEVMTGEEKGAWLSLSCSATTMLETMTGHFKDRFAEGNTCLSGFRAANYSVEGVREWWKDWYKNDYAKWASEH
jgi:hypothetical protein